MNYAAHYDRLMFRAKSRTLIGYCERHHVVPRCMGGGNESGNIVRLTGEEHYVAHQLLVKMHPEVRGLVCAAIRMSKQCTGNKAADARKGKSANFSTEALERIGAASRGNKYALGYKHTDEAKKKIALAGVGRRGTNNGLVGRIYGLATRFPTNYKNLNGMTFGHLVVLKETDQQKWKARWLCRCHCGKELSVTGSNLQAGQYSCGCTHYGKRKQVASQHYSGVM